MFVLFVQMGDSTTTPPKFNSSTLKEKEDDPASFWGEWNFFQGRTVSLPGGYWDDPPSIIAINEFARCCFQTAVLLFHP